MTGRKLKQLITEILTVDDLESALKKIVGFQQSSVVGPLISLFCSKDPLVKGKAISVLGVVTRHITDADLESGRVIMRRLMWSLNDESGGIGWGAPEAMGEIMAGCEQLAREYHKILSSYISPGANYLEVPALLKGALWGVMRLASADPQRLFYLLPTLSQFFHDKDGEIRAFAAKTFLLIDPSGTDIVPETFYTDSSAVDVYLDGEIKSFRINTFLMTTLNPRASG